MSTLNPLEAGPFSISEGKPAPLGVSRQGSVFNFAVYSTQLKKLSLLIYPEPLQEHYVEICLSPEKNRKKNIWCVRLEGLPEQFAYGYRADQKKIDYRQHGPLLLNDPYARAYCGGEHWGRQKETIPRRSLYINKSFDWQNDRAPRVPASETIMYELNLRGFTRHASSGVSAPGSFAGLIEKIPYFISLGVTTIELLPLCEFDETLVKRRNPLTGERLLNFWGYDPLGYFAPKASYASSDRPGAAVNEFKQMVKELHRAGIEVILDVVYNHTGEGPVEGPVFSFRGLDEKTYYMLDPDGYYQNFSGCGNTLNCNHPVVQKMILESLRYWVNSMHIDGFRFDLASILSRGKDGSVLPNPPLLAKIKKDPILSNVKLIAEAWDASGLYQVGSFPGGPQWAEWNDKFRDTIRRFLRGDHKMVSDLATRMAGSSDLYQYSQRTPLNSINYITCHDGFTLTDLVSFSRKRNKANGEDSHDGMNENFSANYGKEGPSSRPEINRLRKKQIKNMTTLLLTAQGVPMILAGDEFGRTQQGNNNAYCQDNEISWVDWDLLNKNTDLFRFFKYMIQFRKNHPALQRDTFFSADTAGNNQIIWYDTGLQTPNWYDHTSCLAFHLIPVKGDTDIYLMTNSAKKKQIFLLPAASPGKLWHLSLDTAKDPPEDIFEPGLELILADQKKYKIDEQSTAVLISK